MIELPAKRHPLPVSIWFHHSSPSTTIPCALITGVRIKNGLELRSYALRTDRNLSSTKPPITEASFPEHWRGVLCPRGKKRMLVLSSIQSLKQVNLRRHRGWHSYAGDKLKVNAIYKSSGYWWHSFSVLSDPRKRQDSQRQT